MPELLPQAVYKRPTLLARLLMLPVHMYRLLFRAWLGASCRFEPTCSAYALQALRQHGGVAGTYLTAARLLRCHPGCAGGCDPVPTQPPSLFRHRLFTSTTKKPL